MEGSDGGRPDARARPQCARPAAGAVLHRDRRSADRGDAVQRSWAVFGGGWAAPSAFIIATVGFTVFSVGYIAMARRVTAAGGFYSFASHGVRTERSGMGVALLIAACYTHLRGRRDRRHGVLREHARSTTGSASTSRSGCSSSARSRSMVVLAFFHIELTAKHPRRLPRARGRPRCSSFGFATLFQPAGRARARARCCRGTSSTATATARRRLRRRHGRRRLLRGLLVMDRLRDGAELRRGVEGSEEDHGPRRRTSRSSASASSTRSSAGCSSSPGARTASSAGVTAQFNGDIASVFYPPTDRVFADRHRRRVAAHAGLPAHDRDGLVRVPARVLQHRHALLLLDGPRGHPAPRSSGARIRSTRARTSRASLVGVLCALIIGGFLVRLEHARRAAQARHLGADDGQHRHPGIMASSPLAIIRYFATEAKGEQALVQTVSPRSSRPAIMFGATYLLIDNRNTLSGGAGIPFVKYMWVPPLVVFIIGMVLAQLYRSRDRSPLRRHRPLPARGRQLAAAQQALRSRGAATGGAPRSARRPARTRAGPRAAPRR